MLRLGTIARQLLGAAYQALIPVYQLRAGVFPLRYRSPSRQNLQVDRVLPASGKFAWHQQGRVTLHWARCSSEELLQIWSEDHWDSPPMVGPPACS